MMMREVGNPNFPIWLVGDSNPKQWQDSLFGPFDPRHPVRHNIWTSILDEIQDRVFRTGRLRVDSSQLYVRNAVDDQLLKPDKNKIEWEPSVEAQVNTFGEILHRYSPMLVLCFGAFSFEFTRRALGQEPKTKYRKWGARSQGREFNERISRFDHSAINAFPLLHRSVSGGKFIQSHEYFVGAVNANYFRFAGEQIADILLHHQHSVDVWIH